MTTALASLQVLALALQPMAARASPAPHIDGADQLEGPSDPEALAALQRAGIADVIKASAATFLLSSSIQRTALRPEPDSR